MILILGSTGYVGRAFVDYCLRARIPFLVVHRSKSWRWKVEWMLKQYKPDLVINAIGFVGKPNVDACEDNQDQCLHVNVELTCQIRDMCAKADVPWIHVSSGCIFNGPPDEPFAEDDTPNFQSNTYVASKIAAENAIEPEANKCWICRLRIPFDHVDGDRNYLSKLLRYETWTPAINSITHLPQFAEACVRVARTGSYGKYNIVNPNPVSPTVISELMTKQWGREIPKRFFESAEALDAVVRVPRSNCVLSTDKLDKLGIHMTDTRQIIESCLKQWICRYDCK